MEIREKIKQRIRDLIEKYEQVNKKGRRNTMAERDVASDFVEPLFEALGWDMRNPDEYEREKQIGNGFIDGVIKIDGKEAIFIETKRFGEPYIHRRSLIFSNGDIGKPYKEEEQLLTYVRNHEKGIKYAILTNFEKFRVFDTFNNWIVLNIENPALYLTPRNFENIICLSKGSFPESMECIRTEPGEKSKLDELESTIVYRGYKENERQQILHLLKWAHIASESNGSYPYESVSECAKNFLSALKLANFETRSTCGLGGCYGKNPLIFKKINITDEGKPIGSQLVNRLIEKDKDEIARIIDSMPAKALKVIFEYSRISLGWSLPHKGYTHVRPSWRIRNNFLSSHTETMSSIIRDSIQSNIWLYDRQDCDLSSIMEHIAKKNIYDLFIRIEKSWEIGNKFYSNINRIGLSVIVQLTTSRGEKLWEVGVIANELIDFIQPYIDANLDQEIKKILISNILIHVGTFRNYNEKDYGIIYKIIKETGTENEIKEIINDTANAGITSTYYYNPTEPPFIVKDSLKFEEYIDSKIIYPVIESIIKVDGS